MTRMAQELANINRHFQRYSNRSSEGVLWYEFDAQSTEVPDLFDEKGRRWKPPIGLAVLWVHETEDPERNAPEGRRTTSVITGAFGVQTARQSGMSDPTEYTRHLNDILLYNRRFYSVDRYTIDGRVDQTDVVIGFTGIEIYPDEDMVYDTLPDLAEYGATRRPRAGVNASDEMWNYPRPARRYHKLEGSPTTEPATSHS